MSILGIAPAEDGLGDVLVSGTVVQSSTKARTGTYSYRLTGSATSLAHYIAAQFPDKSTIIFQGAFAFTSVSAIADIVLLAWRRGGNILGCITLDLNQTAMKVWTGNKATQIGTIGVGASTDFTLIEGKIVIGESGSIQLKVGGELVVDFAGDTQPGTDTTVDNLAFGQCAHNTTTNYTYWDDIIVADDQGGSFNDWLNGIKIHRLGVTGVGNYAQWTPHGAANNWDCVDEVPPAIAEYVETATPGNKDSYALADCPEGLTGILALVPSYWGQGGGTIKRLIRTGGADYKSDSLNLTGVLGRAFEVLTINPATGAGWIQAGINGLELGMEKV